MAVRIRCSECSKKISVDEAFAGSMCRCPYCKSIVVVPKRVALQGEAKLRPSRPLSRPGKPSKAVASVGSGLSGSGLRDTSRSSPKISAADVDSRKKVKRTVVERAGVPRVPGEKKVIKARPRTGEVKKVRKPDLVSERDEDAMLLEQAAAAVAADERSPGREGEDADRGYDFVDENGKTVAYEPSGNTTILETISVDVSRLSQEEIDAIPMADPVRFQGMVAIVGIITLLVLIPVTVVLGIHVLNPDKEPPPVIGVVGSHPPSDNPFKTNSTPSVANKPLKGTVLYCLDAGGSMSQYYPWGVDIVEASASSLKKDQKFGVILAREAKYELLGGQLYSGGKDSAGIVAEIAETIMATGMSSPSRAIEESLKYGPNQIVVILTREKDLGTSGIEQKIKAAGSEIVIMAIDPPGHEVKIHRKVVQKAGCSGDNVLEYSASRLSDFYEKRNKD